MGIYPYLGYVDIPDRFWVVAIVMGFPGGSDSKKSACNAEDLGLIPGLGRSSGEGNGNPLQYSGLENPMDSSPPGSSLFGILQARLL